LTAQLNSPKHLAIDGDDNVLIADDQNKSVRIYDPRLNTLTSILGAGAAEPKCSLSRPHGVYVHTDNSIYVVDPGHHRVLRLVRK
jgi:glucose/arabinose dehydrogenase